MKIDELCIRDTASVNEAVRRIDKTGFKTVVIVGEENVLLGVFTDGDMRRFLLRDGDLAKSVTCAMNPSPVFYKQGEEALARNHITNSRILLIPIVNAERKVINIVGRSETMFYDLPSSKKENLPVVIMAGGKGTRLYPFTKILPKPLIPIGEKSITELIMERFHNYGSEDFHLVLNYKRDLIKAYFREQSLPYRMHFHDEVRFLGTGGGLSLLRGKLKGTVIVSNCDILLDCDYHCIYDYHKERKNKITMVTALKNMTVPYGVVTLDPQGRIDSIVEKPEYNFLINTGVYLIEADVIDQIQENTWLDLPDLLSLYHERGECVGAYPITEGSWLDMGQIEEMKSMLKKLGIDEYLRFRSAGV